MNVFLRITCGAALLLTMLCSGCTKSSSATTPPIVPGDFVLKIAREGTDTLDCILLRRTQGGPIQGVSFTLRTGGQSFSVVDSSVGSAFADGTIGVGADRADASRIVVAGGIPNGSTPSQGAGELIRFRLQASAALLGELQFSLEEVRAYAMSSLGTFVEEIADPGEWVIVQEP